MFDQERKIILKADDRGNDLGVLKGIDELVERGLLTDVSLIIQFTGEEERDLLLQAIEKSPLKNEPGVGILLHVNLVTGEPISDPRKVPSLVEGKRFKRPPQPTLTAWQEYAKTIKPDDVREELDAQIESFHILFGHYPHALDSHNMSLWFPYQVAKATMDMAAQLRIPLTAPKIFTDRATTGPFPEVLVIDQRIRKEVQQRGIPTANYASVSYWNSSETHESSRRRFLNTLGLLKPGTTEFFFHPGHPGFESADPRYKRGRVRDFELLTDPKVVDKLSSLAKTSYKQLSNSMPSFNP